MFMFSKLSPFVFLGANVVQKLVFSKLNEIKHKGILLYAVYFFNFFSIHFLSKFIQIFDVLHINVKLAEGYIITCL